VSQHVIREALEEPGYRVTHQPPSKNAQKRQLAQKRAQQDAQQAPAGGAKKRRKAGPVLFASIRRGATGVGVGFDGDCI
jgi:hypothetical protein